MDYPDLRMVARRTLPQAAILIFRLYRLWF